VTPRHVVARPAPPSAGYRVAGLLGGAAVGAAVAGPVGAAIGLALGGMAGGRAQSAQQPVQPLPQQVIVSNLPPGQAPAQEPTPLPPPLAVAMALLPATLVEDRNNIIYFAVDVTPENAEAPWRVYRRYRDFLDLYRRLTALSPGLQFPGAPFPRKHWRKCTGAQLEGRRLALELWLLRVIEHPQSRVAWSGPLRQFFELGRQPLLTEAPTLIGAVQQQAQQVPAPAAGAADGAGAAQPAEAAEGQALQIDIPEGVAAGQLLGVLVPDGRELHFPVPEGAAPGSQVLLWFEPAAGTLTPLP